MSYYLNHISLSTYGIVPGYGAGSNIALKGFLDLPKRMGKVYHPWPEGDGVEAWVDADHIGFEGRELVLSGIIKAENEQAAYDKLHSFYNAINSYSDLVELQTPYGTFNVMTKDGSSVKFYHQGLFTLELRFWEPRPLINGEVPFEFRPDELRDMVDGIGLDTMGMSFLKWEGENDRPGAKKQERVAYLKEGYHVSPSGPRKLVLSLLAEADTMGNLIANVKALHALFAQVGTNQLMIDREAIADFVVAEGMMVSQVHVQGNSALARLTINVMVMQQNWSTLMGNEAGFVLTDAAGNALVVGNVPKPVTVVNYLDTSYTGQYTHVNAVASADLGLIGLPMLDGIALEEDMLVYTRAQTDLAERKVYTVKAGAWEALPNVHYDGYLILAAGDSNGGRIYLCQGGTHVTSDESLSENMAAGTVLIVTYPTANTVNVEIRQTC